MNILGYLKAVHAQRQINKLARKYKNKKIVIYGAGEYFQILKNNFDLSNLNIVGIADKKFETSKDSNPTQYLALAPEELKEFDLDVILVALYDDTSLCDYLEYQLLINTENEGKPVRSIVEPTILYTIKVLLGK
ncbi:MAG: hypothetical protein V8R70_05025 [Candidatus Gastranaerophilaceae bacterium]|jgi:hypothetical protein